MVERKQTYQSITSFRLDGCTPAFTFKKKSISIEDWTSFTNTRAILANAGEVRILMVECYFSSAVSFMPSF
jgi:hypothetical protein